MMNPKATAGLIIFEMVVYAIIQLFYLINYVPIGLK